jgi:hypothetical protein
MRYFFIHNYKTLGTTIMSQLPAKYRQLFYGQTTLADYEKTHHFKLRRVPKFADTWDSKSISIDHIHIDTMYDMGILGPRNVRNMQCLMLVREPIDRFLSICNYENKSPTRILSEMKDGLDNYRFQYTEVSTKYPWKIVCIKTTSTRQIIKFFKEFGIHIDLSVKLNVSKKQYTIKDITAEQLAFLKKIYVKDFDLFRKSL